MKRSTMSLVAMISVGALLAAAACKSDDPGGGATTSTTGGTTTGGGGAGAAGGQGAGGAAGAGGLAEPHPGPGETCDVFAQDCADPSAAKCRLDPNADPSLVPSACDELLGTKQLNELCTRPTDKPGFDTCDKGLYCTYFSHPFGDPQERECRRLCADGSVCGDGEGCLRVNTAPTDGPFDPDTRFVGQCVPVGCDFFEPSQCTNGSKCLTSFSTDAMYVPDLTACFPCKSGAVDSPCAVTTDCAAGLGCIPPDWKYVEVATCQPWCNATHDTCTPTQTCYIADAALDLGVCVTPEK